MRRYGSSKRRLEHESWGAKPRQQATAQPKRGRPYCKRSSRDVKWSSDGPSGSSLSLRGSGRIESSGPMKRERPYCSDRSWNDTAP